MSDGAFCSGCQCAASCQCDLIAALGRMIHQQAGTLLHYARERALVPPPVSFDEDALIRKACGIALNIERNRKEAP
jgi:hypothetical protein